MWNMCLFHTFHMCPPGPIVQSGLKLVQNSGRTGRYGLHPPVCQIAHPAPQAESLALPEGKPAVPHSLDPAGDEPACRHSVLLVAHPALPCPELASGAFLPPRRRRRQT